MRPLEIVLVAAREHIFRFECRDFLAVRTTEWEPLRRELEEWEAQIQSNMKNISMSAGHYLVARSQRDEIRRLLGRTEPEPTEISQAKAAQSLVDLVDRMTPENRALFQEIIALRERIGPIKLEPEISQATARRLMEVCEKIITAEVDVCLRPDCRVPTCHAIREVKSALAAARAELAGEASP